LAPQRYYFADPWMRRFRSRFDPMERRLKLGWFIGGRGAAMRRAASFVDAETC